MSKPWKHRIENFNAQVKARGVKRAEIEVQLNRIRSSMTTKESESFGTTMSSSKTHSTICTDENSSLASGSSAGSTSQGVIRQGPSEKETIIKKILQRNCGLVNAFRMQQAQMKNMMIDMERKDALTEKLEIELEHIKKECHFENQKTKEDMHRQTIANYFEQVDHIKKELEERGDEQIHFYDGKPHAKAQDVHEELREGLADTFQRIVVLEVELEPHGIRYSSLQDQRCHIDQQALKGMSEGGPGPNESTTNNRQYVQNLLDLDDMERRHVQARVQEAAYVGTNEKQIRVSEIEVLCLEKKVASQGRSVRGDDRWNHNVQTGMVNDDVVSVSSLSNSDRPSLRDERLKKELHILEVSNVEYCKKIIQLKVALNACKASAESQISKDRMEHQRLSLDNDALTRKIAALEVDASHGVGHFEDLERCRRCEHLQKRLDGNEIEILSLQDHLRTKDRIIAALRTQTVRKQLGVRLEATPSELIEAHSEYIEFYLEAPQWIGGDQASGVPTEDSDISHFYDHLY